MQICGSISFRVNEYLKFVQVGKFSLNDIAQAKLFGLHNQITDYYT